MTLTTRIGSVTVYVETAPAPTAHTSEQTPGRAWVDIGGAVTLHGTFGDLERCLYDALVAVRGLQPPTTVAEFLENCVNDCIEGR